MKTFKNYLKETKLVLRGFGKQGEDNKRKGKTFLDELQSISEINPLNNKTRVIGNSEVHVSYDGDGIHIHDIRSFKPGSGAGTEAMKILVKLADKHRVKLNLFAKGYSSTTTSQLKKWYRKFDFTHEEDNSQDMVRYPK